MHGSELVGWMLVALCGGVGTSCLWRLRDGPRERRRSAAGEALMGFGMAVMAVPAPAVDPPPQALVALFGVAAVYELMLAASGPDHRPHHLHHAVGALAMVHMALAMAVPSPVDPSPGSSAGAHVHHPAASADAAGPAGAVTAVLLVYFAVYVVRAGVRLIPAAPPTDGGTSWPPSVAAHRPAMGLGMFTMLLGM